MDTLCNLEMQKKEKVDLFKRYHILLLMQGTETQTKGDISRLTAGKMKILSREWKKRTERITGGEGVL
jgi:hypothetical protein